MGIGGFSPAHIIVVLMVALIVLGPTELPKVIRGVSRLVRELRNLRAQLDREMHTILEVDDENLPPRGGLPPASSNPDSREMH